MFRKAMLGVALVLLIAYAAAAHDTWIEKRDGKLTVLRGHHGTVESYNPKLVKQAVGIDSNGKTVEVEVVNNKENAILSPKGNPAIVGALYDSGYWLKTTDGWKKATKREGQGKYNIVESIRSKQWCKNYSLPTVKSLKPIDQGFEVVPEKEPTALRVGDTLPLKVFFEGDPVEGAIILVGGGHASDAKNTFKTDEKGAVNVKLERAGLEMIKATHKVPIKNDPDADVLYLQSTMTFNVQ